MITKLHIVWMQILLLKTGKDGANERASLCCVTFLIGRHTDSILDRIIETRQTSTYQR